MTPPRLRVLYAAVGGGIGTLLPYLVLYLTDRGLSPADAGVLVGLMSAVGVLVIPLWGRLADGDLGVVRALRLSSLLAAAASLALLAAGRSVAAVVVCAVLLAACRAPGEALADALTVDTLGDTADYGRVRLWASAGFAVAVGVWGVLLARTGLGLVLVAYPAALVVTALSARGPHRVGTARPRARRAPSAPLPRHLLVLLAGVLVFGVAMSTAFTVLPLRVVGVGGTLALVGASSVVGALAEIPLMHASARLTRAHGPGRVVVLGGLLFAGALVLYGTVPLPWVLVGASALRGAGYALVYVGFVVRVRAAAPAGQQARSQALLQTALMGVAPVAGASLGGVGFTRLPPALLFGTAAAVALVGTLLAASRLASPAPSATDALART